MIRKKFNHLNSTAVPLPVENVDTDQIIPARFLKATTREGFGDNLFRDWRYNADNQPIKDFVLNQPQYKKGEILVAGKNFGSGSSREHAAWAIHDYGFRVVISSFFADIFRGNALNNGVLPITVTSDFLAFIFSEIEKNSATQFQIKLDEQTLELAGEKVNFEINAYKKACLMNGHDDIDYLCNIREKIEAFELDNAK